MAFGEFFSCHRAGSPEGLRWHHLAWKHGGSHVIIEGNIKAMSLYDNRILYNQMVSCRQGHLGPDLECPIRRGVCIIMGDQKLICIWMETLQSFSMQKLCAWWRCHLTDVWLCNQILWTDNQRKYDNWCNLWKYSEASDA